MCIDRRRYGHRRLAAAIATAAFNVDVISIGLQAFACVCTHRNMDRQQAAGEGGGVAREGNLVGRGWRVTDGSAFEGVEVQEQKAFSGCSEASSSSPLPANWAEQSLSHCHSRICQTTSHTSAFSRRFAVKNDLKTATTSDETESSHGTGHPGAVQRVCRAGGCAANMLRWACAAP